MTPTAAAPAAAPDLLARYRAVRAFTEQLCEPLCTEDYVVQSMPDASPTRWHIAHVSWFFETFVLREALPGLEPLDARYHYLFNSYYNAVGAQFPRPRRGLLSRPTVAEVFAYRRWVDEHMEGVLADLDPARHPALAAAVVLGLNHEQQHQELILTDIKHVLAQSPLFPAYRPGARPASARASTLTWVVFEPGLTEIGHDGRGFAFDNEGPRHQTYVQPFELASRPVTNGEYLEFVEDGGYRRPELWLSDAWLIVPREGWSRPDYWHERDGRWHEFTLGGLTPLDPSAPAAHLSYYEADAYARWAGARLPRECEWEAAAAGLPVSGNFVESAALHPRGAGAGQGGLVQMFGDVWEWTSSAYSAYPGYRPLAGAFGEYNGKFMCNQFVLRGGSCATSLSHIRPTYRNFFPPAAKWQFSGLRLARDA